jgi:hypothetical protein
VTTTLKLDWAAERTQVVLGVLAAYRGTPIPGRLMNDLAPYREAEATIKLDWPKEWIRHLVWILEKSLHTSEEIEAFIAATDSPDEVDKEAQAHVRAAIEDIRGYREAVEAVKGAAIVTASPEPYIYFVFEHGGNRQDESFDSAEKAFEGGDDYAESHKRQWGFRHPITVFKITEEKVHP